MDTHVTAHLDLPDYTAPRMARLPEDPHDAVVGQTSTRIGDGSAPDGQPPATIPRKSKGRAVLLAGAAVLTIAAGGAAFLVSPYNQIYPVSRMVSAVRHAAAKAGVTLPAPLAPAASLASVALPPAPPPAIREAYRGKPRRAQMDELLALQPADHPEAAQHGTSSVHRAAANLNGPPPGYAATEPGSAPTPVAPAPASPPIQAQAAPAAAAVPRPANNDVTRSVIASVAPPERPATPPDPPAAAAQIPLATPSGMAIAVASSPPESTTTAAVPPQVPKAETPSQLPTAQQGPTAAAASTPMAAPPAKPDPTQIVLAWQPAPMTGPEQVQVLGLVTQLATMVRDLKAQDAQLRSDFAKATADSNGRLTDFERRLELSEAQRAVAAAKDTGNAPSPVPPAGSVPAETAPPVIQAVTHVEPPAPTAEPIARYRVQAASPGLAMLAQVDRGGGDGAQIQVVVGDVVPGYGRVKSVAQHGVSWVVNTEHGDIGE